MSFLWLPKQITTHLVALNRADLLPCSLEVRIPRSRSPGRNQGVQQSAPSGALGSRSLAAPACTGCPPPWLVAASPFSEPAEEQLQVSLALVVLSPHLLNKAFCDHSAPAWLTHGNSKARSGITPAGSLSPCKVTCSQALGTRAWASLGA